MGIAAQAVHRRMASEKSIFVTVGTTKFNKLIEAVANVDFAKTLSANNYRSIFIQYGNSEVEIDRNIFIEQRIQCETFAFSDSITSYMEQCDVILCHGGSGTILEGMCARKILIVVPNTTLQDNHQIELAERFAQQNYVLMSTIDDLLPLFCSERIQQFKPTNKCAIEDSSSPLNDFLLKTYFDNFT